MDLVFFFFILTLNKVKSIKWKARLQSPTLRGARSPVFAHSAIIPIYNNIALAFTCLQMNVCMFLTLHLPALVVQLQGVH